MKIVTVVLLCLSVFSVAGCDTSSSSDLAPMPEFNKSASAPSSTETSFHGGQVDENGMAPMPKFGSSKSSFVPVDVAEKKTQ